LDKHVTLLAVVLIVFS